MAKYVAHRALVTLTYTQHAMLYVVKPDSAVLSDI